MAYSLEELAIRVKSAARHGADFEGEGSAEREAGGVLG